VVRPCLPISNPPGPPWSVGASSLLHSIHRKVAEYLAALSRDARVVAVLGVESSVCWLQLDQKMTVPADACTHACIAVRPEFDTKQACVHHAALLGCTI
jgi:hypothetical protein